MKVWNVNVILLLPTGMKEKRAVVREMIVWKEVFNGEEYVAEVWVVEVIKWK